MQSKFVFLSVFLFVLPLICSSARILVGEWQPIKDLNDPHIKKIATFAVAQYDKQSGFNLKLDSIVKGEEQVVSGMNYRLTLAVKVGEQDKTYVATVWEKIDESGLELISFVPA